MHYFAKVIRNLDTLALSVTSVSLLAIKEWLGVLSLVFSLMYTAMKMYNMYKEYKQRKSSSIEKKEDNINMLPFIFIVIMGCYIGSCVSSKEEAHSVETHSVYVKDSTGVTIDTVEVPIYIPGDELKYEVQLQAYKDSLDSCRIRPVAGRSATLRTSLKFNVSHSGLLRMDVVVQPYQDTIQMLNKTIAQYHEMYDRYSQVQSSTKVIACKCSVWKHWEFWALLIAWLLLLVWQFRKYIPYLKLLPV